MFPKHLTVHLVVCEISKYPQDATTPVISVKYPTVRETRLVFHWLVSSGVADGDHYLLTAG